MPTLDPETGKPQLVDEDGVPIEEGDTESVVHRPFALWQDTLVDGAPRIVGGQNLLVPDDALASGRHYPGWGGDLARLLYPVVIADEKQINPNVKPDDAWGWLPPPLVGEGKKVQSAWLHKFLLNPHPIRPPAVLRMPRFHFNSAQAAALVNYFAAVDGAEYPYVYDPRLDEASVVAAEQAHPGHLDGALKIVTNNNYCVKCHLVGDYTPRRERQGARAAAAAGPRAAPAGLRARLDRESEAVPAVHRHAREHSLQPAGQSGPLSRHERAAGGCPHRPPHALRRVRQEEPVSGGLPPAAASGGAAGPAGPGSARRPACGSAAGGVGAGPDGWIGAPVCRRLAGDGRVTKLRTVFTC
jgi:hypothetical protein